MIAIKANETTAALRRIYFFCVDATDGITPETGETGGQPQISINGGAWANSTGVLVAIGNGFYYLELTQAETNIAPNSIIASRYKSANTTETSGTVAQVFLTVPTDFTSTATGVLGTLIKEVRQVVKDTNLGANSEILWNELEWIEYFNSAEREITERAHAIEDETTASICTITLLTGIDSYSLNSNILYIETVVPSYDLANPLTKRTENWLDTNYAGWRNLDDGQPLYVVEKQTNKLMVVPAPSATYNNTTLTLKVKRRPLNQLSYMNTTPEVGSEYYDDMKHWALFRAFSKRDAEIYDEQKATFYSKHYYNLFESRVGPRPDSNTQRIMKQEPVTGLQITPYR